MSDNLKYAGPVGRVLISLIFIFAGLSKLGDIAGTQGYMEIVGVPGILVWPAIALEVVGGLFILIGYQTRIAALALAAFTLVTAFLFHFQPADMMQMTSLMKNLAITGGFLFLAVFGPGLLALDNRTSRA